jgi:hypothetical protein
MRGILSRKREFVYIIAIMININNVLAQGVWNIYYLPVDSLKGSFIGKEIRLDFKSFSADTLRGNPDWMERKLLSNEDTVTLILDGECRSYKENWKLYPDHGVLREQSLVSIDKKEVEQIKEIFLESVNESSIIIEVAVYDLKGHKRKQKGIVCKCDIKGILIKVD